MFRLFLLCLCLTLAAILLPGSARASDLVARNLSTIQFSIENDWFGGTDRHYTSAVKLTWLSPDRERYADISAFPDRTTNWLDSLPLLGRNDGYWRNLSLSIGQAIYTPQNTQRRTLIKDDRPYAGWTYLALAAHNKNAFLLDTFELSLGVVGPESFAEETQKNIHSLADDPKPRGWEHQLENEPGVMLTWLRTMRLARENAGGWGTALIPHAGFTVGNVETYANLGGELQIGWRIPSGFGTSLIRPGGGVSAPVTDDDPRINGYDFGFHTFVYLDGRAVARNIFLDGNTFTESHSVEKNNFVADLALGACFTAGHFALSYTHVVRSKEFTEQEENQIFGSVALSYSF